MSGITGAEARDLLRSLAARLNGLLKSGQLCRRLKPAQKRNKPLIGTTEVVPCYKALATRVFQQPVKPAREGKIKRVNGTLKRRTTRPRPRSRVSPQTVKSCPDTKQFRSRCEVSSFQSTIRALRDRHSFQSPSANLKLETRNSKLVHHFLPAASTEFVGSAPSQV